MRMLGTQTSSPSPMPTPTRPLSGPCPPARRDQMAAVLTCWEGVRTTVRATRTQSPHFLLRVRSATPGSCLLCEDHSPLSHQGRPGVQTEELDGQVQGRAQRQGWKWSRTGSGRGAGSCQGQGHVRVRDRLRVSLRCRARVMSGSDTGSGSGSGSGQGHVRVRCGRVRQVARPGLSCTCLSLSTAAAYEGKQ